MKRKKHPYFLRVLSTCLLLSLLNTACRETEEIPMTPLQPASTHPGNHGPSEALFVNQFLQKLIVAIHDADYSSELYDRLPSYEGTKPTPVEMKQYMQVLHEGIGSDILSFTPMSTGERKEYLQRMKPHYKTEDQLEQRTLFYWFELRSSTNTSSRFPFVIWLNEKGQVTFPRRWINDSYWLYSQARLYFKTVDTGSPDALLSLLKKGSTDAPDLLEARVHSTLDYYQKLKEIDRAVFRKMSMTSLTGDAIEFRQIFPYPLNSLEESKDHPNPEAYRSILFNKTGENQVQILDLIPSSASPTRFSLFSSVGHLLSLHQPIDAQTLQRILGYWQEAFFYPNENHGKEGVIRVNYQDMEILIAGEYRAQMNDFTGSIISIAFTTNRFHLDDGMTIGDAQHALYLTYPYLPLNEDYLSFATGDRIQFQYKDEKITRIVMESPEARAHHERVAQQKLHETQP